MTAIFEELWREFDGKQQQMEQTIAPLWDFETVSLFLGKNTSEYGEAKILAIIPAHKQRWASLLDKRLRLVLGEQNN